MKERPILFSAPMVRAILDGRKTQTRRIVKPRKDLGFGCVLKPHELAGEINAGDFSNCPYGQPGDRLWVKETFWRDDEDGQIFYAANPDDYSLVQMNKHETGSPRYNWKPSIFMPRLSSRILLEIVSVRVEKLQDISEADAMAEGANHNGECDHARYSCADIGCFGRNSYRGGYAELWESINGQGSWDANPWVWGVEFFRT